MICELYDIIVYDSTMDYVHGNGRVIREIFIPKENKYEYGGYIINEDGGIFEGEKRYNIEYEAANIELDDSLRDEISNFLNRKKYLEKKVNKVFSNIK